MPAAPAQLKPPQIAPRPPAAMPLRARWRLFAPAAAKPSGDWDARHAGVPLRRRWPMAPGSLQRSVASRPSSIAAAAPDPTEPKTYPPFLIRFQLHHHTLA